MNILDNLRKIVADENILIDEPMKKHTSFKIGGIASFVVIPGSIEEVRKLVLLLKNEKVPYFVMGNGSNLLVTDKGYKGVIIKMSGLVGLRLLDNKEKNRVEVMAGTLMSKTSSFLKDNFLDGFAELSGIPGTVGGAVYMNAGAYGREIKDLIVSVTCLDKDGNIKILKKEELDMSYRHSIFSCSEDIVLSVVLELCHGDREEISNKIKEVTAKRVEKQPLNFPSAGSTFKRPEGFFAAKIIEDCGFKGKKVGGAMVSEKHSGFVINCGNATCNDVIELTNEIKKKAKEKFDVDLELEVKILGE